MNVPTHTNPRFQAIGKAIRRALDRARADLGPNWRDEILSGATSDMPHRQRRAIARLRTIDGWLFKADQLWRRGL